MIKPKNIFGIFGAITVVCIYIIACTKDTPTETPYVTTPYSPPVISGFRPMPQDSSNPMTLEGIALGEKLFFDPILSKNNTISCASCHKKENAFSDPRKFSLGVDDSVH
jgi:cytochrome c peroxidase